MDLLIHCTCKAVSLSALPVPDNSLNVFSFCAACYMMVACVSAVVESVSETSLRYNIFSNQFMDVFSNISLTTVNPYVLNHFTSTKSQPNFLCIFRNYVDVVSNIASEALCMNNNCYCHPLERRMRVPSSSVN